VGERPQVSAALALWLSGRGLGTAEVLAVAPNDWLDQPSPATRSRPATAATATPRSPATTPTPSAASAAAGGCAATPAATLAPTTPTTWPASSPGPSVSSAEPPGRGRGGRDPLPRPLPGCRSTVSLASDDAPNHRGAVVDNHQRHDAHHQHDDARVVAGHAASPSGPVGLRPCSPVDRSASRPDHRRPGKHGDHWSSPAAPRPRRQRGAVGTTSPPGRIGLHASLPAGTLHPAGPADRSDRRRTALAASVKRRRNSSTGSSRHGAACGGSPIHSANNLLRIPPWA
jgi:hypothetical protein